MHWYYSKDGHQNGPVAESELRAKLASGEISRANLVWKDGMPDWLPASAVAELRMPPEMAMPNLPGRGGPLVTPYAPPQTSSSQAFHPSGVYRGAEISTNLWQSIAVTLLCCLPFGIVAIVYAAKVDGYKAQGDFAGAMVAAASSRKWCNISVISYLGIVVFAILFSLLTNGLH